MNSIIKTKSVKEIWKYEKSQFRIWIVAFIAILVILFALFLTSFIYDQINKSDVLKEMRIFLKDSYEKNGKTETDKKISDNVDSNFLLWNTLSKSLALVGFLGIIAFFAFGLYESYKRKNFKYLNQVSIQISFIIAFYSMFLFIYALFQQDYTHTSSILNFIFYIFGAIPFLSVTFKISRIRRIFAIADYYEKMSKDPKFQQLQKKINELSAISVGGRGPKSAENSVKRDLEEKLSDKFLDQEKDDEIDDQVDNDLTDFNKLNKLGVKQLREIAKNLYISGYDDMTKKELIKYILRSKS